VAPGVVHSLRAVPNRSIIYHCGNFGFNPISKVKIIVPALDTPAFQGDSLMFRQLWLAFPLLMVVLFGGCLGGTNTTDAQATSRSTLTITPQDDVVVLDKVDRPNFLFILTDDLDAELGSINYMPYLQELLISKGLTIADYYISNSVCCPSRSTYLRGQYNHNNHIYQNTPPYGGFQRFYFQEAESSTIATWLQAAGYRTALFGKYLNGYPFREDREYVPAGWTEWYGAAKGKPYRGYSYVLNENGSLIDYEVQEWDVESDYITDVLSRKAAQFIRESADGRTPFFAFLSVYAPHQPAQPAPRHKGLFPELQVPRTVSFNEADVQDKPENMRLSPLLSDDQILKLDELYRGRVRSLQSVDEMIADLVKVLGETGQLENTYIIFTSDNGFHLGQHRLTTGKGTAYEEDIHVPFFIRGPEISPGSFVSGYISGNVDFAPTIAELAGVIPPPYVDGRSMVPLFGSILPALDEWRSAYLLEAYGGAEESLTLDTDSQATANSQVDSFRVPVIYMGLRTQDYLYVEHSYGFKELYDMRTDPGQIENLALTADPALLDRLSEWLHELYACSGSECTEIDSRKAP
jgi:arylsulfatase A-like enzyme